MNGSGIKFCLELVFEPSESLTVQMSSLENLSFGIIFKRENIFICPFPRGIKNSQKKLFKTILDESVRKTRLQIEIILCNIGNILVII